MIKIIEQPPDVELYHPVRPDLNSKAPILTSDQAQVIDLLGGGGGAWPRSVVLNNAVERPNSIDESSLLRC